MTQEELLKEARTWQGVPFRHQGRSKDTGVDCIGYFVTMLHMLGVLPTDLRENPAYGPAPNSSKFIDTLEKYCTRIEKPEDAALVAIKWFGAKYPSHCAIIDGPNIIHAYQKVGKVIKVGYREPWLRLTYGLYRLPGIEIKCQM